MYAYKPTPMLMASDKKAAQLGRNGKLVFLSEHICLLTPMFHLVYLGDSLSVALLRFCLPHRQRVTYKPIRSILHSASRPFLYESSLNESRWWLSVIFIRSTADIQFYLIISVILHSCWCSAKINVNTLSVVIKTLRLNKQHGFLSAGAHIGEHLLLKPLRGDKI